MNNFEKSMPFILSAEGGYCNDSHDPGGETKYGIDKADHPDVDIANLTVEHATTIYYSSYWMPLGLDHIPWPLCLYVFDCAVNQGPPTAARLLQQALNVAIDGKIGPLTLAAANNANADQMAGFMTLRLKRYISTVNFGVFGTGWINRITNCVFYAGKNS